MSWPMARDANERHEEERLAPWGMAASASRGRRHPEEPDPYRSVFQRDRDRIIHTNAFRRLESKTQVFVARTGDHYRTRLTHSIEVAQISRSIARILGLNEDLTEAVALAHDLGHTPFGHSGGDVLSSLMASHGGFEHNRQSLRLLDHLECRYPGFRGLNLTYEVRECILKHSRPFVGSVYDPYDPSASPLLEGQLVDVCDGIAYNSHDLDDGLRAGILKAEEVAELGLWRLAAERVEAKHPGLEGRMVRVRCVGELINVLIHDLLAEVGVRLSRNGISSVADVRRCKQPLVGFSDAVARLDDELRSFLYESFYTHSEVLKMRQKASQLVESLFNAYVSNPRLMPETFQTQVETEGLYRTVADYIAGMTDPYAQHEFRRVCDPGDETG